MEKLETNSHEIPRSNENESEKIENVQEVDQITNENVEINETKENVTKENQDNNIHENAPTEEQMKMSRIDNINTLLKQEHIEQTFEVSRNIVSPHEQTERTQNEMNTIQSIEKEKQKLNEITSQLGDLNATLNQNKSSFINQNSYSLDKKKQNLIKKLTKNKSKLALDLEQLNQNEQILAEEGYLNLSSAKNNTSLVEIDKNIRKEKIKEIKKTKEIIQQKITEINTQINNVLEQNKKENNNKTEIIRNFLENFEHDKMIAEIQSKKFKEHKRKRNDRYLSEMREEYEKRIKSYESMEKEKNERKKMELKIFHDQEKMAIAKRKEAVKKEAEKTLQYVNNISPKKKYYSLSEKNEKEFKEKQEELINQEKMKRKQKMKPITAEELNQFEKQIKNNENLTMIELEQKQIKMKELWKERKDLLPKYRSPFLERIETENKEKSESLEHKKIDIKLNIKLKNKISNEIKQKFVPKINPKLQKELQERIKVLTSPPKVSKSSYNRRNRIILKKIDESKISSKFKWKLKLKNDERDYYGDSNTVRTVTKGASNKSISKIDKRTPLDKPIDYLREERQRRTLSKDSNQSKEKNWDKLINSNSGSLVENIENVKLKAEMLQKEAEQKKKLMNIKGGSGKVPELGEEISNLYINSIEAKLKILNAINK